jgi:hypothetical protein
MKVSKRIVKLPPPLATEEEALKIKHYLVDLGRSFSGYALEAVLEKMARDCHPAKAAA